MDADISVPTVLGTEKSCRPERPHGVPCDICDGARDAVAVVLGGDAVQIRENERVRLAGMPHMVTPCCGPCFYMATGRELSHMLGADAPCGGAWTVLPLFVK